MIPGVHRDWNQNGVTMQYYTAGHGEPLLFLHGAGIGVRSYRPLLTQFADKCTLYAPDIPGFGYSDAPTKHWRFHDYALFLDQFLTAQDLTDVTVVGHSFGGGISIHLAAHSEHVSRLVLLDSIGGENASFPELLWRVFISNSIRELREEKPELALSMIGDIILTVAHHIAAFPRVLNVVRHAVREQDFHFDQVDVPTLLLWGNRDSVFPPADGKQLQEHLPGAQLRFVDGTHDWPLLQPGLCTRLVREWQGTG